MIEVNPRYMTLVGILDDPLNMAILEREIRRRRARDSKWGQMLLPPPIFIEGRLVYPTMRGYQKDPSSDEDCVLEITPVDQDWYIFLDTGEEIGPLDSLGKAKQQAEMMLHYRGYQILPEAPWTKTEASRFPIE